MKMNFCRTSKFIGMRMNLMFVPIYESNECVDGSIELRSNRIRTNSGFPDPSIMWNISIYVTDQYSLSSSLHILLFCTFQQKIIKMIRINKKKIFRFFKLSYKYSSLLVLHPPPPPPPNHHHHQKKKKKKEREKRKKERKRNISSHPSKQK